MSIVSYSRPIQDSFEYRFTSNINPIINEGNPRVALQQYQGRTFQAHRPYHGAIVADLVNCKAKAWQFGDKIGSIGCFFRYDSPLKIELMQAHRAPDAKEGRPVPTCSPPSRSPCRARLVLAERLTSPAQATRDRPQTALDRTTSRIEALASFSPADRSRQYSLSLCLYQHTARTSRCTALLGL